MKTCLAIPQNDKWPYAEVVQGLDELTHNIYESDNAVVWTLWRGSKRRRLADKHTEMGKPVLCLENGWLPNHYQIMLRKNDIECSGVNGAGAYPITRKFEFKFKDWHQGEKILICPQRGVTPNDPDISHGQHWCDNIVSRINLVSDREIMWRARPDAPCLPKDTSNIEIVDKIPENPWCCVVYSSLIGVHMLQKGTPVIADGPQTMYADLADTLENLENPKMLDRQECFNNMANMQWHIDDIKSGKAFEAMLES